MLNIHELLGAFIESKFSDMNIYYGWNPNNNKANLLISADQTDSLPGGSTTFNGSFGVQYATNEDTLTRAEEIRQEIRDFENSRQIYFKDTAVNIINFYITSSSNLGFNDGLFKYQINFLIEINEPIKV